MFEWFRALHIVFMIAWMAGLLLYPRLLVYRMEAAGNPGFEAAMDAAARRTRNVILTPSMILVWLMGLAMFGQNWESYLSQGWFLAKLALVAMLSAVHGYLVGLGKKIAAGERPVEPKRLRMLNEIPMVIAVFAVVLVVIEPF
jgi:protoporphyrinogen IX oxidase